MEILTTLLQYLLMLLMFLLTLAIFPGLLILLCVTMVKKLNSNILTIIFLTYLLLSTMLSFILIRTGGPIWVIIPQIISCPLFLGIDKFISKGQKS
jgi:hypothetical protein